MVRFKFALLGAVCVAAGVAACSTSEPPAAPTVPTPTTTTGPNGETLKVGTPTAVSPVNGAQPTGTLTLVFNNAAGTNTAFAAGYRYEVRTTAGAVVASGTAAAGTGATTSVAVAASLNFDTEYTWRVRAEYQGQVGSWSSDARFRSPVGGYIRGSEIMDPLTKGTTVGQTSGSVTFIPGVGIRLNNNTSYVVYELPVTLQEGEYSFMATNVDEGNPGDKSKVMSMAEGFADVTDNDYRMTLEVRGSSYPPPGTVSYRIITGDAREEMHRIRDAPRVSLTWTRADWYFFKMWWKTGTAGYEIRHGSPSGPVLASHTLATSGHPYRPVPHVIYIGAPNTRAGELNATHAGMTVKDLWVSASPRPNFPQ